nr:PBP1A family penicillin-binding protein [Methylomarinum sp. Ch1-1]MDP4522135.1 PBP1A family penicillin-binding protein [Methylomarinum sp. Ch1-1]
MNAFLAAEDDRFYEHPGVDYQGLLRAVIQLILTGKKKQGGSTITMQVARNFLLSREKTYVRKIKEIILALKIEQEYSKDKILQLYLNKIYLGHRSYGIAAAALTYYGKPLSELDLAQMAMLAGLPKAPSNYNPVTDPERALLRRNYVLRRMRELSYIDQQQFDSALNAPVTAALNSNDSEFSAPYIAEMVRQKLYEQYGEEAYTRGLNVYTTITSELQSTADHALKYALHAYDQRHGYRSLPHKKQDPAKPFAADVVGDTQIAVITALTDKSATAILADRAEITLPWRNIEWARAFKSRYSLGAKLKSPSDILAVNDLIRVRQLEDQSWALAQVPETEAGFVALNPQTGAILALSGGFDFFHNKYNRAIQSKRQPGSGFKPIIYTTALEHGFTPASIINDAPVVVEGPNQESNWRPENYSRKFFGPTPLRTALRKSRNLISIRLLRELGIAEVSQTALRFGFKQEQLPNSLSLALGSGYATPLQMARMYATFANGGFLIEPYFISRIENKNGEIEFEHEPAIACPDCEETHSTHPGYAPRIISREVNFLMNSLLRDVVQRGTATRAKRALQRSDLAGKTGTTNEQRDAWFNGFTSEIAATAWLGFDDSKPLGRGETGSRAALPMWIEFMKTALKDQPEHALEKPDGIGRAFINPQTGLLARPDSETGIWEYFRHKNMPTQYSPAPISNEQGDPSLGTGLF